MTSETSKQSLGHILLGLFVAIGIAVAGWFVYSGLTYFRSFERTVSVKGLSEREVIADLAVWPITFSITGNELSSLQSEIRTKNKVIYDFLGKNGIQEGDIEAQPLQSQDLMAQGYRPENIAQGRYVLTQNFTIRTTQITNIDAAIKNLDQLLSDGVVLNNYGSPTYLFTKLNDIKPEMLDEAIEQGKTAAQKFAAQSGQKLGKIKTASQGVFQIKGRDDVTTIQDTAQKNKTVRVVSTIEFYLE